jgi:copper chaperone CopZ
MADARRLHPDLTLDFPVRGMTCASCAQRVEKAILAVPGVKSASVNPATHHAHVSLAPPHQPGEVADAVRKAGYQPVESEV